MSEGEIIEQLVEYMNVTLVGVSIFVTIVSAYLVGLYAFLARAAFLLKLFAFLFVTAALGFLAVFLNGAQTLHRGLIEALAEMEAAGALSPAGRAALENARGGVDDANIAILWATALGFWAALALLTFFSRATLGAREA